MKGRRGFLGKLAALVVAPTVAKAMPAVPVEKPKPMRVGGPQIIGSVADGGNFPTYRKDQLWMNESQLRAYVREVNGPRGPKTLTEDMLIKAMKDVRGRRR